MQLTLRSLIETVRQELGQDPALSSAEALVNEAGEAWVDAHDWNYLRNRSLEIDLVPDQEKYRLDAAVMDIGDYLHRPNSVWTEIPLYDWSTFISEKERFLSSVGREFQPLGTTIFEKGPGDEVPHIYIQIWPAGIEETVVVEYTSGWEELDEMDDVADLPPVLVRSFREWVRRYALGRENQPQLTIDAIHESFFRGPFGQMAMRRDGKVAGYIPPKLGMAGVNYHERKLVARGFRTRDSKWYDRARWYYAPPS